MQPWSPDEHLVLVLAELISLMSCCSKMSLKLLVLLISLGLGHSQTVGMWKLVKCPAISVVVMILCASINLVLLSLLSGICYTYRHCLQWNWTAEWATKKHQCYKERCGCIAKFDQASSPPLHATTWNSKYDNCSRSIYIKCVVNCMFKYAYLHVYIEIVTQLVYFSAGSADQCTTTDQLEHGMFSPISRLFKEL